MTNYRIFLYLMFMNSLASVSKNLYPNVLSLGKILGFFLIIIILHIYIYNLKKKDLLLFLYLIIVDILAIFRLSDISIDLENIIFFSSTCLMLWKFTNVNERIKLKNEVIGMGKKIYYGATILLLISIIGLFWGKSWEIVNGQKVYFGFCESGHKLSANMCFVGTLYLIYFWNKKFKIKQLIYFLIPLIIISLTGSRTYLISYVIILLVLYFKKLRNYKLKIILVPILIFSIVYFLLNSSIVNRFFLMGSNHYISNNFWEATSSGRLIWWKIDLNDFKRFDIFYKIFGQGFTYLYDLNKILYGLKIDGHNDFITLLISIGLFGTIGYIYILIRWIFKRNIYNKTTVTVVILTLVMYLWNAMISGVFGAQQYIFANILMGVVFLDNIFVDINNKNHIIKE